MDRASDGIRFEGTPALPPGFDPNLHGPFDRATAIAVLRRADDLLDESEPEQALVLYGRVAGSPDRDLAAAAAFGAGTCLYRLDRDGEALKAWESVAAGPESPSTYRAWRQIAAARVRAGDLPGALEAYRQCGAPARDEGINPAWAGCQREQRRPPTATSPQPWRQAAAALTFAHQPHDRHFDGAMRRPGDVR
jgi:tetratricopeptide (TPR) repeat protein